MTEVAAHGEVRAGFEPVRAAFDRNFVEHGEIGASVAVYVHSEKVVDLWGGTADPETGRPWAEDSIATIFSVTKGAAAILCVLLAERGELDLDARVSRYWPEFAANGKEAITVRHLLSHTAGLPVVDAELTMVEVTDGRKVIEALALQAPLWEPGTKHGYHALTYGWLVGEVLLRATGRTLGQLFATEVAGPLGLDFFIGLPEAEEPRVAPLVNPTPRDPASIAAIEDPVVRERFRQVVERLNDPTSLMTRSHSINGAIPGLSAVHWNRPDVHASEQAAVNGIADARSVARLFAACIGEVDGIRLLSDEALRAALCERAPGPDEVLPSDLRFGTGLQLPADPHRFYSPTSFGHPGAAGALGFADPTYGVAFGYVPNYFGSGPAGDPRSEGLIAALHESLGS